MQVREVVFDMARILKVEVEEFNNEFRFYIPADLGTGYVKATSFDHGIGVIEVDFQLKKEVEFTLDNEVVQPLKFIFNKEATIKHRFRDVDEHHEIKHLECAIVSCNGKHGHVFTMPAEKQVRLFSLEINRKLFEEKIAAFLRDMNEELEELFRDLNGVNLFYFKGHYSLDIAHFIEEFTNCKEEGFVRSVFLEGKAYEILTHHLGQYLTDLSKPDGSTTERQSTVKRIEAASGIIKAELESISNIPILAKRVGLSQQTLQRGFKNLYNASVNEFIRNYRIEFAKKLIETTELNITEISYKVGINSRSYFSKIFKEKYGVTPKQYYEKCRAGLQKKVDA